MDPNYLQASSMVFKMCC